MLFIFPQCILRYISLSRDKPLIITNLKLPIVKKKIRWINSLKIRENINWKIFSANEKASVNKTYRFTLRCKSWFIRTFFYPLFNIYFIHTKSRYVYLHFFFFCSQVPLKCVEFGICVTLFRISTGTNNSMSHK